VKVEAAAGCCYLEVRVSPRARRTAVTGVHDGALKVALAAPPADGAANDALVVFLAEALGCRRGDVAIVRGPHSRSKRVLLRGVSASAVRELFPAREIEPG
jgi:hypothetical protein